MMSSKSKIRTEIAHNYYQNRSQYVRVLGTLKKKPSSNPASIDDLTPENAHRGCHDVLKGQGSLKTQKFVQIIDCAYKKKMIIFLHLLLFAHVSIKQLWSNG